LDDHAIVFASDGSIVGFVGGQVKDAVPVDGSSRLDFVVSRLDFDRADMRRRAVREDDSACHRIGEAPTMGATEGESRHPDHPDYSDSRNSRRIRRATVEFHQ